jgi:anti-anti-sigma factor
VQDESPEIVTPVRGDRLTVSLRDRGSATEVDLHGELDLASAPLLAGALGADEEERSRPHRLVVDVSELTFVDAAGLRVLLGLAEDGRTVVLRHPSRLLLRILDVTDTAVRFDLERR